jgi:hypothetical protein
MKKSNFISSFPENSGAGFSTCHPAFTESVATASTGLFPKPFLISVYVKELIKTVSNI